VRPYPHHRTVGRLRLLVAGRWEQAAVEVVTTGTAMGVSPEQWAALTPARRAEVARGVHRIHRVRLAIGDLHPDQRAQVEELLQLVRQEHPPDAWPGLYEEAVRIVTAPTYHSLCIVGPGETPETCLVPEEWVGPWRAVPEDVVLLAAAERGLDPLAWSERVVRMWPIGGELWVELAGREPGEEG